MTEFRARMQRFRHATAGLWCAAMACTIGVGAPAFAQDAAIGRDAGTGMGMVTMGNLPAGTLSFSVGSHQTAPGATVGTGSQIYFGGLTWAITDRLSVTGQTFLWQDPPIRPIGGVQEAFRMTSNAVSLSYRVLDTGRFSASVVGSVEQFLARNQGLGNEFTTNRYVIGSLHAPLRFQVTDRLALLATPSVSVFPESTGGGPFYGTVVSLGGGVEYQVSQRLMAFGSVAMPVSGGNTITGARAISAEPVYVLGARYGITPRVALEGYVTNAIGTTPATRILTYPPDGTEPLFGLRLVYTPSARNFPTGYGDGSRPASTSDTAIRREDGVILANAGVIGAGQARATLGINADGAGYAVLAVSPDRGLQIEGLVQLDNAGDPAALPFAPTQGELRWMVGGRFQLLDRFAGDPFSLSVRVLGGRDFGDTDGSIYVALPIGLSLGPDLDLTIQPAAGAFGAAEILGVGFGAEYRITDALSVMVEAMPTQGANGVVGGIGARYRAPSGGFSVDLSATNAIGRQGYNTLIAQDAITVSLGLNLTLDLLSR